LNGVVERGKAQPRGVRIGKGRRNQAETGKKKQKLGAEKKTA